MIDVATLTKDQVFQDLGASRRGLSETEAAARLAKYGENRIPEVKKASHFLIFLVNFYHTFAILLWFSAALAFVADMAELGFAIIGVIVINAAFSFWQEYKAEKATEALLKLVPTHARVMRDGEIKQIFAAALVPGDLLILEEGDNISADARLVEAFELRTNNANLSGESEPVRRTADAIAKADGSITEAPNLVFSGTSVASGTGRAVVFATGQDTQFGHVALLTQTVTSELSPLQKEVKQVALAVAILSVMVGFALFLAGSFLGRLSLAASAIFAIGMITANVPEGLLPTLSLSLAAAVQKMARQNALVKKLSAVETLGSATVICTDKTGTLTQNEMTVRAIWANQEEIAVTGAGYAPIGQFLLNTKALAPELVQAKLGALFKTASYCNKAKLNQPTSAGGAWAILGDPTEAALLVAVRKAGYQYENSLSLENRLFELPFDSVRKRMAVVHQVSNTLSFPEAQNGNDTGGNITAYIKGAPREVLDLCTHCLINGQRELMTKSLREKIMEKNDAFAKDALRVLAFALKDNLPRLKSYEVDKVETELTFLGLMAMQDPPRPEVAEAVKSCQRAGIRVIMITGDYGLTALSVAQRIGIIDGAGARIITGSELDKMDDSQLDAMLNEKNIVFARVAPHHKLRITTRLQQNGHVVAMTGDGVNDAPALKKADIGIAMGITGTDVAKEAADVILLDDNFASIVKAIAEGRAVYDNIKKFIVYIFAHLGPEAVPFIFFVLFRTPLPITPMQIIAIDLGTETLPALALGIEKAEPDVMARPPRSRKDSLLGPAVLLRAYLYLGIIESILVMAGYFWVLYNEGWHWGVELPVNSPITIKASTMTFLGIVATQVGTVIACRTNRESVFTLGLFSNPWIIWGLIFELVTTIILLYVPPVADFFGMAPLGIREWLFVAPFPFIIFAAEELRKLVVRRLTTARG